LHSLSGIGRRGAVDAAVHTRNAATITPNTGIVTRFAGKPLRAGTAPPMSARPLMEIDAVDLTRPEISALSKIDTVSGERFQELNGSRESLRYHAFIFLSLKCASVRGL
jgi:hypothetical protein